MRRRIGGDPDPPVALVERPVEHSLLVLAERLAGPGQHQREQALKRQHALGERVARVGIRPVRLRRARRQVEGVDADGRAAGEADHLPADRLADAAVLVLGVDHVVLDPEQQRPQHLDLAGVGLAGPALREDDLVGVLLVGSEGVEDHQRAVVDALAVEQPAAGGESARGEGDHRRHARGVEVAAAPQVVLPGRKAREQPRHHLVESRPDSRHHPAERPLDARRCPVELLNRAAVHPEVEASREDALVAALQRVAQPLGILVGDLALGGGDAPAPGVEQARGLELHQAVGQAAHRVPRVQRLEVQAEVERRALVDEPPEPVRGDVARVVGERQHARELPVDGEVAARLLDRRGRDQVGGGALARCEAMRPGRAAGTARPAAQQRHRATHGRPPAGARKGRRLR